MVWLVWRGLQTKDAPEVSILVGDERSGMHVILCNILAQ
jgi:hypothetical protein